MSRRLLIAAALAAALPSWAAAQASKPAPPPANACADPQHGQFDFWVGRWDITPTGKDTVTAHSLIEKVYGCGIRENWMPNAGGAGGSLSIYVPAEKGWRQTWIDFTGSYVDFKGGWDGHAMVLTGNWPGPDGKPNLVRMTYTQSSDGSVRQAGAASKDGGKTWAPTFDLTYHKASPVP
ncbi:hypothetical protein [Phenylobacterium sp.]|jgi:hypothetical protein|uniref:hypothetical protein n=1 Tax=Phenylobacterium sp. TaxID=1871053 RepID=UPI002F41507D